MKSVFTDKGKEPTSTELKKALGITYDTWQTLADFTREAYPAAKEEWNLSGEKYGWSFRISDKKRVLLYLLPRDRFFKAAFVFGQKAMDKILESDVDNSIKDELKAAKPYAEGRGIRIEVKDKSKLDSIQKLIAIKIAN